MRDKYGGYISEGWLDRRRRAYAHAGEVPPPIVVDERGIAHEVRDDTRGGHSLTVTCQECRRIFDLLDENDANEWHYGHDCEEDDSE